MQSHKDAWSFQGEVTCAACWGQDVKASRFFEDRLMCDEFVNTLKKPKELTNSND